MVPGCDTPLDEGEATGLRSDDGGTPGGCGAGWDWRPCTRERRRRWEAHGCRRFGLRERARGVVAVPAAQISNPTQTITLTRLTTAPRRTTTVTPPSRRGSSPALRKQRVRAPRHAVPDVFLRRLSDVVDDEVAHLAKRTSVTFMNFNFEGLSPVQGVHSRGHDQHKWCCPKLGTRSPVRFPRPTTWQAVLNPPQSLFAVWLPYFRLAVSSGRFGHVSAPRTSRDAPPLLLPRSLVNVLLIAFSLSA